MGEAPCPRGMLCSGGPTSGRCSRVGLLPKTASPEKGDRKFCSCPGTFPVSWVTWSRELSKGDAALAPKMLGLGRGAGERKNLDLECAGHVRYVAHDSQVSLDSSVSAFSFLSVYHNPIFCGTHKALIISCNLSLIRHLFVYG